MRLRIGNDEGRRNRTRAATAAMLAGVAGLVASVPAGATTAGGEAAGGVQHCRVEILAVGSGDEAITSGITCTAGGDASLGTESITSTIAVHFDGLDFSGSSLTVTGTGCNGYWWNLPSAWNNRISSTFSSCATRHYDGVNKTGTSYTTYNPGGNMNAALNNKATSVAYNP